MFASENRWVPAAMLAAVLLLLSAAPAGAISSRLLAAIPGQSDPPRYTQFGFAVASVGDIDGDGEEEVVVGAPDLYGASSYAYIFSGRAGGDSVLEFTLGDGIGDYFGYAVSSAGDVNGDGYPDLVVGAPLANSDDGAAYVYYGGPGFDTYADLVLTGNVNSHLGVSVSAADVNHDGFHDLIVGVGNEGADGGVYVYYGGLYPDSYPDLVFLGHSDDQDFGEHVASAGDVNGDGYEDIIVGAEYSDAGPVGGGRAYLFFGGIWPDTTADIVIAGTDSLGRLGSAVCSAGDMNGDGYDDFLVGDCHRRNGGVQTGWVGLFLGGPEPDAVADLALAGGATPNPLFGYAVAPLGDVNLDGYDDFVVGAAQDGAGGGYAGAAYVYLGGLTPDAEYDLRITGPADGLLGFSVSSAGDFNADGIPDLLLGAPDKWAGGVRQGGAYVYEMVPLRIVSPNGGEAWVMGGEATICWESPEPVDVWFSPDAGLTWDLLVSGVGGAYDNCRAVLVPPIPTAFALVGVSPSGQSMDEAGSDASDAAFRVVAPGAPVATAYRMQAELDGGAYGTEYGAAASPAGDVNGDGFEDFLVADPTYSEIQADAGRVYVYAGGPGWDEWADLILDGEFSACEFGRAVAPVGDVNRDGYDDFLVGAPGAGDEGSGAAFLFYGGALPDTVPDVFLAGGGLYGERFGFSLASAGDLNGDGCEDVIVGAPWADGSMDPVAGRAYVFLGGDPFDTIADLVLEGPYAYGFFGYSVSSAGDVNGDGYDDFVVGAYRNYPGGTDPGHAYIYFGGPGMDSIPDLTLNALEVDDHFARTVASPGDMNGDGYDDVLVSAHMSDAGGTDAGRVYVYFGGPSADRNPDLAFAGETPGDRFGRTLAAAGDVNGDGLGDMIVGAPYVNAGGSWRGRTYVYFGAPAPDAVAEIVVTGEDDNLLGGMVAAAGDVNGDGLDDFLTRVADPDLGGKVRFYDAFRYLLLAPNGGETWSVGASHHVTWLGAEPADLWLSVDAGASYDLVASRVGGRASNTYSLTVPHLPTRYALAKLTPSDPSVAGADVSDSLFTINASVTVVVLRAGAPPEGAPGITVSWQTDPGPEELAGYRLEKAAEAAPAGAAWNTLVALTREESYHDLAGRPGARYRLTAVNGLGEEFVLGETTVLPHAALAAGPLPYHGGEMKVTFATTGGLGGGAGRAEVALYDVTGRLVRLLAGGDYLAGVQQTSWDGEDAQGNAVAPGIYFLRLASGGHVATTKVTVVR